MRRKDWEMVKLIFLLFPFLLSFIGICIPPLEGSETISMTIVYDNYIFKEGTESDQGFACFIQGTEKTILFDTGRDGNLLLRNIDRLGIIIDSLDLIVISHEDQDVREGLNAVLGRKSNILVYLGASFPTFLEPDFTSIGSTPIRVDEPIKICEHVFSTGEMQGHEYEQSLILDTEKGLVIITGCSHPGIIKILKRAQEVLNKNIYLVFGGFHLLIETDAVVNEIIGEFKRLGVEKVGASNCTGDSAIALFQAAYGKNYIPMGVGQVIQVP